VTGKRIEIVAGPNRVRIEVDGETIADAPRPTLLYESGLPVRYYLPREHVRMDLLTPSEHVSHCPYKGRAEWWSVRVGDRVHEDLAWSYPAPIPASEGIAGLIAFYDDRVDVHVDGSG
jgi:uncharacterized protein (DUF427 family)